MEISYEQRVKIEAFLFLECRLADESQYAEWEKLLDDEVKYIVYGGETGDENSDKVAVLNDHKPRLATRIRQYQTGRRFAQVPPSPMRRLLSNIELTSLGSDRYEAACNFVVFELQIQMSREVVTWAGRVVYGVRETADGFRMFSKKIELINRTEPLPNLAFLI